MYYTIYKVTLLKGSLAGHYYYGQHRTKNLNDNYAGSGRIIVDYFKKYGKIKNETFVKEILGFYNSLEELNYEEEKIVGTKYKDDPLCLNLKAGGNAIGISEETKKLLIESHKGKHQSEETRLKISKNNGMKNKEVSKKVGEKHIGVSHIIKEDSRKKISETLKRKYASGEIKVNVHHKGNGGYKMTEEAKRKISEATKEAMKRPDVKAKLSKAKIGNQNAKGHSVSEESKMKMKPWLGYHWKKDPETGKRIFYKDE